MRSRWFPDNSVCCADNFVRLCHFCFGLTVFPIMITDYKIDVQQTPQIPNKMMKESITLEREYVQNCEKIFTGGDWKKK